ncbi:chromate transporter [Methylosinus sp. sav-2]|uniref:chromate efflux transporter n=1 Tax=Methylosinus sp. sav-2 TaxID=2485168 RepID=UPI00068B29FC|nr:chromate efflux transporter [Methylosinus sp. sav-2]TDX65183.1 chromate transporter [Methylosinus sp. sav-2]
MRNDIDDIVGSRPPRHPALEALLAFLQLGLTSFGGPIAHIGYFRAEFVERRKWLSETAFADLVALCQFLPGPASSQLGFILGMSRAGLLGGFSAWLGFTLPSAVALVLFAYCVSQLGDVAHLSWLHGLAIVAVAVVAQAVWGMARSLCPDRERATIALAAMILTLALPSAAGQIGAIVGGGLIGWLLLPQRSAPASAPISAGFIGRRAGLASLALFVLVLIGAPILAATTGAHWLAIFAAFFRSGALVFGGGHVVLPLLQQAVTPPGWIGSDAFLAGYVAAQAVPGPLFTFAAFLGAAMREPPNGWAGAILCLVAIYLPSLLLLLGVLPFWDAVRGRSAMRSALAGVNAAVVGILTGALYTPVWTSAVFSAADFCLAATAYLLLVFWRAPAWLVVLFGALGAVAIDSFGRSLT